MRHHTRHQRGSASRRLLLGIAALATTLATAVGCVDEKVVYRDAPRFEAPTAAAAKFVGYRDTTAKATVCGSCHIGAQSEWAATGHADAWKTLQASTGKQAFCEDCHAVSGLGNATLGAPGGWTATKDLRYKDVQCESCHGPGLDHVASPNKANIPLATIRSDSTLKDGCGGCHNGTHHPFVAEWQQSGHGQMTYWSASGPNTRAECQGCHTGQGALQMFGADPRTNYKEKVAPNGITAANAQRVTCAVCHDPHAGDITGQLRLSISVPDENRNLCMNCHHKRGVPDLGTGGTTTRGAHSPEGPMLLGEAGWWPPNSTAPGGLERIETSHGSQRNPRMCAGCHMEKYQVTDKATGQFRFQVTGHRFLATPCVGADGLPTRDQSCGENLAQRRFTACATSGCHASEGAARSVTATAALRINTLNAELKRLIALPAVRAAISGTDRVFTTAEGAQFNTTLADKHGAEVHNPFLMEALLTASIQAVRTTYNVTVASNLDLRNTMLLRAAPAATPAATASR